MSNASISSSSRKRRNVEHPPEQQPEQNGTKFVNVYIIGQGQITPIVLRGDIFLSDLRFEMERQKLPVPPKFYFIHPSIPFTTDVASHDHKIVTEPQEDILSTKDFPDGRILLMPNAIHMDLSPPASPNSSLVSPMPTPILPSTPLNGPLSPSSTSSLSSHVTPILDEEWRKFQEMVTSYNLSPIMNLNTPEKFVHSLPIFFEGMCHIWGANECMRFFMESIYTPLQRQFHGILTKFELSRTLSGKDPGTFLCRISLTQKNSLVVSYVSEDRGILSIPMELKYQEKPFRWRIFNPLTNRDEEFDNVTSYLSLITVVANKPLMFSADQERQEQGQYSDHQQLMHMSFWVKKFLSIN
eukprot:TRINITY_DN8667_c0_g2_i2.p1 TRINITY_DN8667_c0_g2~~TRINITY_DN8667_c0_g2_i2.p1  ORF type:complete len:355 (+),score=81.67 TRINITY_DN8667_c0_g2_i2:481-1545(+)